MGTIKISVKTLVIHPQDPTTDFLGEIYSDKDWTVINTNTSKKFLKEQVKAHDRIVMLGHGTKYGLIGYNKLVIDSNWAYLLRSKTCVCIWCNADLFVEKYGLVGFYTGMIISEYEEALLYGVPTNKYFLTQSNILFADAIKKSIDSVNMVDNTRNAYITHSAQNEVIAFNCKNIYFKKATTAQL